jgi:hypothetical protein
LFKSGAAKNRVWERANEPSEAVPACLLGEAWWRAMLLSRSVCSSRSDPLSSSSTATPFGVSAGDELTAFTLLPDAGGCTSICMSGGLVAGIMNQPG